MQNYELLLILDEEGSYQFVKDRYFKKFGVQVRQEDVWGERRLAYPVKKRQRGFFIVLEVELDKKTIPDLRRDLELEDKVLRSLIFSK